MPSWVAVVLMALGVAAELLVLPGPHLRPGIWALGTFALAVPTAEVTHRHGSRPACALAFVFAVLSGLLVAKRLPASILLLHGKPHDSVWFYRVPLLAGAAFLVAKITLLDRYAMTGDEQADPFGPELEPLPFQGVAISNLVGSIRSSAARASPRLLQLEGRWGEGKTWVLHRAEAELGKASTTGQRYAVVWIDIWKYQTERDLDFAIFERLLTSPANWKAFGWMRYPIRLLGARWLDLGMRITAKLGKSADWTFEVPPVTWQRPLERLFARALRRGFRTVLILDEVDRAAPAVAQSALTLSQRSLDRPGVTIVLAYVKPVLAYKVFNPLAPQLADLGSTTFSHLYAEVGLDADSLALLSTLASGQRAIGDVQAGATEPAIEVVLGLAFAALHPSQQRRLQDQVAEKHLNAEPIIIPRPEAKDVAMIPFRFPQFAAFIASFAPSEDRLMASLQRTLASIVRPTPC